MLLEYGGVVESNMGGCRSIKLDLRGRQFHQCDKRGRVCGVEQINDTDSARAALYARRAMGHCIDAPISIHESDFNYQRFIFIKPSPPSCLIQCQHDYSISYLAELCKGSSADQLLVWRCSIASLLCMQ